MTGKIKYFGFIYKFEPGDHARDDIATGLVDWSFRTILSINMLAGDV